MDVTCLCVGCSPPGSCWEPVGYMEFRDGILRFEGSPSAEHLHRGIVLEREQKGCGGYTPRQKQSFCGVDSW